MTLKKYILTLIAAAVCATVSAQTFVEGSLSYIPVHTSSLTDWNNNMGFGLNLQYGKFVNNYKMRSFAFTVRHLPFKRNDVRINNGSSTIAIDGKLTTFCLGYERKVTFAASEFDDQWQYYTIINYYLNFTIASENYSQPGIPDDEKSAGAYISPDIGIGLGMARKLQNKAYAFVDARFFGPIMGEGIGKSVEAGASVNLGVRYFLR